MKTRPLTYPVAASHRTFVLLVVLVLALSATASGTPPPGDAPLVGRPLWRIYPVEEYGGHPQVHAVAQDRRGLLYFTNRFQEAVLEYDGARWRSIPIPGLPHALAPGPNGRIYVGGSDQLGYLEPDSAGEMSFHSLLDKLPPTARPLPQTNRVVATEEGVLFVAETMLLRWHEGTFSLWPTDTHRPFTGAFALPDRVYVAQRGVGLLQLRNDTLELAPGSEAFAAHRISTVMPMADTSALVVTRQSGLFSFRAGVTSELEMLRTRLARAQVVDGRRLWDGSYALATLRAGCLLLAPDGTLRQVLDRNAGLPTNAIYNLFADRQGALWLATEDGIVRIEIPAPLTLFDEASGLEGNVDAIRRHRGVIYAATLRGIYRLITTPDGVPRFTPYTEIPHVSTHLLATENGLLAATDGGVYRIDGDEVEQLTQEATFVFHRSRHDPDRVFIGLPHGLGVLRRSPSSWRYTGTVPGIEGIVRMLAEDQDGALWAASRVAGRLLRIDFVDGLDQAPRVARFRSDGFERVYRIGDTVRIVSEKHGMLRYTPTAAPPRPYIADPDFDLDFGGRQISLRHVAEDRDGNLWLDTSRGVDFARRQPDGRFTRTAGRALRIPKTLVMALYADTQEEGVVWIGGRHGIFRYDTKLERPFERDAPALIRHVGVIGEATGLWAETNAGTKPAILPYDRNDLRFEVAIPQFDVEEENRFQFKLEDLDRDWSPWTSERYRDYTHVPPGSYTFRVRARDVYERLSPEATFRFRILKPWYQRWWAYALYGLLALGLFGFVVRLRSAALARDNRRLEALVAERTQEIEQRNIELEMHAAELKRRRELDAQLQRTQKLESLAVLAGGIAHDFNNILVGVLGNADLALLTLQERTPARDHVTAITHAATRAAELCRQMLAYSGRGQFVVEEVDLNTMLRDTVELTEAAISKKVTIHYRLGKALPGIQADPTQIRQILLNLLHNAAEALEETGGAVTVTTSARYCDATYLAGTDLEDKPAPGHYVFLEVSDTGVGMDEATRQKIFDPFFSTKFTGRGLGLAAVQGIVRGHRGTLKVDSTPGRGTIFRILFPALDHPARPAKVPQETLPLAVEHGTILLVDDEETVRDVGSEMLIRAGFHVRTASDGATGLDLFRHHHGEIDCVILDFTMPRMDGEATFHALHAIAPDVKVILSSGFSEAEATSLFPDAGPVAFLQKPYSSEQLLDVVRRALQTRDGVTSQA